MTAPVSPRREFFAYHPRKWRLLLALGAAGSLVLTAWAMASAVRSGAPLEFARAGISAGLVLAMLTVHLKYGFSSVNTIGLTDAGPQFGPPGYEVNLLYIAGLISLILGGAGSLSVDHMLSNKRASTARTEMPEQAD